MFVVFLRGLGYCKRSLVRSVSGRLPLCQSLVLSRQVGDGAELIEICLGGLGRRRRHRILFLWGRHQHCRAAGSETTLFREESALMISVILV